MPKKAGFKKGTANRKARGKMAEGLKAQGYAEDKAFKIATSAVQKMSAKGKRRMMRRGMIKKKD